MPAESSPFPGMDPFLEQYWGDVHQRLITYGCDQIQAQLPQGLYARVQERVFLEDAAVDMSITRGALVKMGKLRCNSAPG